MGTPLRLRPSIRARFDYRTRAGAGNSTTVFTDCANAIGKCKVVSVGYDSDQMWKNITSKNLKRIVGAEWGKPLEVLHADIMDTDFTSYVAPADRVLLFWDAHGYELAFYILRHILSLLEPKEHQIVVHDITDVRYTQSTRAYIREDGLPVCYADYLTCPFDELYPLFDFLSRNRIRIQTADHSIFNNLKKESAHWNEVSSLFLDAYGSDSPLQSGHMVYFNLSDREDKHLQIVYPPTEFAEILASQGRK